MTTNTSQNTRRARRRCARKARPPEFKPRDARFRILAEHSNDIFFSMRFPEGRYEFISPCVEKLFGFSPRDFYDDSMTVLRCVAPAWRERVQGWIGEIAQGRVADELEFQVLDRAGRTRWLQQRQVLVPAPDGQGWLLQGVATDITNLREAQEALQQSEERFREVVEGTQSLVTQVDGAGLFTYVNPVARTVFGLAPEDCLGRSAFDFVHPEDSEATIRAFSGWVADRLAQACFENRQVSLSGEVRHFAWHTHLHYDEQGRPTVIDGIARDITEQKRAEEALRQINTRYALLAENLVDIVWTTDAELRWTYLSPSAEKLTGVPLGELLQRDFSELFTPESLLTVGQTVRSWQEAVPGTEAADCASTLEMELNHADGRRIPLEVLARPLRDGQGQINGYCGTTRDITERKQVEAALRRSEERYALALQGANDGIWDWDLVQDKVYFSDRWKAIIGYGPDELRHEIKEWTSRIHPEDFGQVMAENRRCIDGQTPIFQVEYRLRHKDGSYRWIFGRGAALADASGRVLRMAGAHTDITSRKQAEEALLKSERLARKLLESMHGGVWAVDANRRTTFVNERLCAMLGYSTAELMNMSPLDVLEWPQRHTVDIRFHERESGVAGASDYVLVRKDGSRFPAHVMSSPIMEAQGAFEGLVCGVVDLTERARMEHELRRNQARFEALYELSRLSPATEQELAAFSLREAIRLTDSAAGVLFFVSPDGQSLEPKAWETEDFIVGDQVPSFPSSGPLPWALVLQSGQPLVLNDFSGFEGLVPPGHPAITRFLGVPALDLMRTVAVLGLTGKATPYTAEDTLQSTLLLDGMWRVVRARRDEERIRASLREKDALLHEVHHRVKNNLQVIASLLDMSGRRLASPEARLSLSEVRGKVQAMSLIHAQLHSAVSPGGISLERFVRALFNQLQEVYAEGLDMTLHLQLGNLTLGLDQAVPLGLALNEALANVFKHACQQDRKAEGLASRVEIRATRDEADGVTLEVRDNGPGLPAGLDPAQADSLGMKLMFGLIRHQLRGELDFADAEPGVSVRIRFRSFVAK